MPNWELIKRTERAFDRDHFFDADSIQVVVEEYSGGQKYDLFAEPTLISSGVYTVPGVFEYRTFNSIRYSAGGAVLDGDAFFLTDASWTETMKKDGSYILRGDERFAVGDIEKSNSADSILVSLKRKR